MAVADTASRGLSEETTKEKIYLKERLDKYCERMKEPEVTGKDLIALGIKPGPAFSDILKNSHKQHLSGQDKDKVLKGIETVYNKQIKKEARLSELMSHSSADDKSLGE